MYKLAFLITILAFLMAKSQLADAEVVVCENIPVKVGPGEQSSPAIWDNYVVWKGAENEAYDLEQEQIVEMPGLVIDGIPAIWDNKAVWSGATGYYDFNLQQMVYPDGLTIPEHPAIPAFHSNKIVWRDSNGYYDLVLEQMVYPPDLAIGSYPDIFDNKIVWDRSKGYYDIDLQIMVLPEGMKTNYGTAMHDSRMVWNHLDGGYFDMELGTYYDRNPSVGMSPDIFGETVVWHTYAGLPSVPVNVYVWDPICGRRHVTNSGSASGPKIYGRTVVWTDRQNGDADIYMTKDVGCCGDADHPYPVGDLNHDCQVDFLDLALLMSHWLECTLPCCR